MSHANLMSDSSTRITLILVVGLCIIVAMMMYFSPYRTCLRGMEGMEYTPPGHTTSRTMTFSQADHVCSRRHTSFGEVS